MLHVCTQAAITPEQMQRLRFEWFPSCASLDTSCNRPFNLEIEECPPWDKLMRWIAVDDEGWLTAFHAYWA